MRPWLYPFHKKMLATGGTVTILGSTGSIGTRTLEIIRDLKNNPQEKREFRIQSLTAHRQYELLARQALEFQPDMIVIADDTAYPPLRELLAGRYQGKILAGHEGVLQAASQKSDYVMAAIVGTAGLLPTLAAAHQNTIIALANKECLVTGGQAFLDHIVGQGALLFPIDSEHHALYTLLSGKNTLEIDSYYITASGGAFRDWHVKDFHKITPQDACQHPTWSMGQKISVDSATMMNKGLELIEAAYLFGLPAHQCDAILHPQSVIHGMLNNRQGEIYMLASLPDMGIPIFNSLTYDHHLEMGRRLHPKDLATLSFSEICPHKYPLFMMAKECLAKQGIYPILLNAFNEILVHLFLTEKISYIQMPELMACLLESFDTDQKMTSGEVAQDLQKHLTYDAQARLFAQDMFASQQERFHKKRKYYVY